MEIIYSQLEALKKSLAKKLYEEISMIERYRDDKIDEIDDYFNNQLSRIEYKHEYESLRALEEKYNRMISDNIIHINKSIIDLKYKLFSDFFDSIQYAFSNLISDQLDSYLALLAGRIRSHLKYFDSNVVLYLNLRDVDYIKNKIAGIKEKAKFQHEIIISDTLIESVGGFVISDEDKTFSIDRRFESLVNLKKDLIALIVEKAYPDMVSHRESASELLANCKYEFEKGGCQDK